MGRKVRIAGAFPVTPQHFLPPEISQEPAAWARGPHPSPAPNRRADSTASAAPHPASPSTAVTQCQAGPVKVNSPAESSLHSITSGQAWTAGWGGGWALNRQPLSGLCRHPGQQNQDGLVQALHPVGVGRRGQGEQAPSHQLMPAGLCPSKAGPSPGSALSPPTQHLSLPSPPGNSALRKAGSAQGASSGEAGMSSPLGLCPDSAPAWGCPVSEPRPHTVQAPSPSTHRSTV